MTVAAPSNINANLVQEYWDNELEMEILNQDIFSNLTSVMDDPDNGMYNVPEDAMIAQCSNKLPSTGERTGHIGFLNALQQPGGEGDLFVQVGNEETLRTQSQDIFFNEFSHAVSTWAYGIRFHEAKPYGIYTGTKNMPVVTKLLGNHAEERFGQYRRQALLETLSQNLVQSPTFQTQQWNPNFFVKNVTPAQQPVWNNNLATYTNNIAQACVTAGTGVAATADSRFMNALRTQIKNLRIEPLVINGKKRYILTLPTEQCAWFRDLDTAGSGGANWTSYARLNDREKLDYPGLLGEYYNILIMEDERAPTLTIGGSVAPFSIDANYMEYGNDDDRDTSADARQVGFLLGRGALVEWYPERVHHEYDYFNYWKWIGKGYFGMIGDNLRWYSNNEQNWSIVCVFANAAMSS